ncbi:hypothetical protein Rwratislav_29504 [Rhodococcus wratislaviensis IFP 2016]|nr:hypothetical protein Rwratislav_29504 [Rhodococcus wratislaviensis IFP 2016]
MAFLHTEVRQQAGPGDVRARESPDPVAPETRIAEAPSGAADAKHDVEDVQSTPSEVVVCGNALSTSLIE